MNHHRVYDQRNLQPTYVCAVDLALIQYCQETLKLLLGLGFVNL